MEHDPTKDSAESDFMPPRWQSAVRWGASLLTLAALAVLAWGCLCDPRIHFLTPGPGKWIIYPLPPDLLGAYPGVELAGNFRRTFVLPDKPAAAALSVRCMTSGEIYVNNTMVPPPASVFGNWKATLALDVAPFLRAGSNEISVVVKNKAGPPALSLELKLPDHSLRSDETWEVSVSGSDWHAAQIASVLSSKGQDQMLDLLGTTGGALRQCRPWLCLLAVISICGVAVMQYAARRTALVPKILLFLLAAAWLLLFVHNIPHVPAAAGFDARDHLAYVRYVQEYRMLPSAWEGWEMFQPPLYYVTSAVLLGLADSGAFQSSGMIILRYLSLVIGAVTVALLYVGLRLVFPGDWKKPLAGLVIGAFLPAQICLLHYTTNETLSAMFVTGAMCVTLYLLRAPRPGWGWSLLLGIVLGLALLSKASGALVLPVVAAALAMKLMLRRERSPRIWLGTIGGTLLVCALIAGWHYVKLWRDYGNPMAGNWDPKVAESWWQAKGFQTPAYFLYFGEALVRPFYSGLHSFWDGFYSTLWGDGLAGGVTDVWARPPWNYDFMAIGYVLALIPTTLVLTGLVRAVAAFLRAARLSWLLLLGVAWLFSFAILGMGLKVPSYAQIKAFYGLPALLPFCALGALGFDYWAARGKAARFILYALFGIWAVNVYVSFWIRPATLQSETSFAISSLFMEGDHAGPFSKISRDYPQDTHAAMWLALLEAKTDPEQAVKRIEQAIASAPPDARLESALAQDLGFCNRLDEGVIHAKRAAKLAPDYAVSFQTLALLELRRQHYADAIAAARRALSLNPTELMTRFNLGVALMNQRQIPEATGQFLALVEFKPGWAEAQYCLGKCLLGQPGKHDEALAHLQEAARLDPSNVAFQTALQNANRGP